MSLRVVVRSPAETDLLESALFIAEDNPAAAQRFDPALAGLRLWPVPGFEKFRICYIPREDHIDVLRVLHGARDSERFFE